MNTLNQSYLNEIAEWSNQWSWSRAKENTTPKKHLLILGNSPLITQIIIRASSHLSLVSMHNNIFKPHAFEKEKLIYLDFKDFDRTNHKLVVVEEFTFNQLDFTSIEYFLQNINETKSIPAIFTCKESKMMTRQILKKYQSLFCIVNANDHDIATRYAHNPKKVEEIEIKIIKNLFDPKKESCRNQSKDQRNSFKPHSNTIYYRACCIL